MTRVTGDPIYRSKGQTILPGMETGAAHAVCAFYRDVNVKGMTIVHYDVGVESSGWLFKSPLAG